MSQFRFCSPSLWKAIEQNSINSIVIPTLAGWQSTFARLSSALISDSLLPTTEHFLGLENCEMPGHVCFILLSITLISLLWWRTPSHQRTSSGPASCVEGDIYEYLTVNDCNGRFGRTDPSLREEDSDPSFREKFALREKRRRQGSPRICVNGWQQWTTKVAQMFWRQPSSKAIWADWPREMAQIVINR